MKLVELDPRFFVLEDGGPRVGLTFECPCCIDPVTGYSKTRLAVFFHERGKEAVTDAYIAAKHPGGPDHIWTEDGKDVTDISLSPSIDASAHGHWHGFITNGEIR